MHVPEESLNVGLGRTGHWGAMGHPVHHGDTARPRCGSTCQSPTKWGEEQGMGTGRNRVHPLLWSAQAQTLQQGFDCFFGYF